MADLVAERSAVDLGRLRDVVGMPGGTTAEVLARIRVLRLAHDLYVDAASVFSDGRSDMMFATSVVRGR